MQKKRPVVDVTMIDLTNLSSSSDEEDSDSVIFLQSKVAKKTTLQTPSSDLSKFQSNATTLTNSSLGSSTWMVQDKYTLGSDKTTENQPIFKRFRGNIASLTAPSNKSSVQMKLGSKSAGIQHMPSASPTTAAAVLRDIHAKASTMKANVTIADTTVNTQTQPKIKSEFGPRNPSSANKVVQPASAKTQLFVMANGQGASSFNLTPSQFPYPFSSVGKENPGIPSVASTTAANTLTAPQKSVSKTAAPAKIITKTEPVHVLPIVSISPSADLARASIPGANPPPVTQTIKPKLNISFSAVADKLQAFILAKDGARVFSNDIKKETSSSSCIRSSCSRRSIESSSCKFLPDCEEAILTDFEANIKRSIRSGDPVHITSHVASTIDIFGFRRLPCHVYLLNEIKNNSECSEVAVSLLWYLYRNCLGSWKDLKLKVDLSSLMICLKNLLTTIQNITLITRKELEDVSFGGTVYNFQIFVELVVDIAKKDNLVCTDNFANTWLSYLVDTINNHISRETPTKSDNTKCIVYKLAKKELSQIVIQKCFNVIAVLLTCSPNRGNNNAAQWGSLFGSKDFLVLDSIFFLKYFHIDPPPLKDSFEDAARACWGEKDRIVLSMHPSAVC